jgi:SAM-dependent methyltransferase
VLYQNDLAYIQAAAFGVLARGAASEIVRRLKNAAIPIRNVVDVGCGAGPLAEALVKVGFEVTGFDTSAELLQIAARVVPGAHLVNASVYDAEIPACEAVLAVGEPLTYHAPGIDAEGLLFGFFQSVSAALPPGGLLIFDVIEIGEPSLTGRFWRAGEDWAVLSDTVEDPPVRTLVRNILTFRRVGQLYRRGTEIHQVRLFDTQVLCDQLATCGFTVETSQAYGAQPLNPRRRAFFATRI